MRYKRSLKSQEYEKRIQEALSALQNKQFISVRAAASHFGVARQTLLQRHSGGNSHAQARELQQILTNAEEKTLVRWIERYSIAGSPISSSLLLELAQLIRIKRVRYASSNIESTTFLHPIGHEWLYRFIERNLTIKTIYTSQMSAQRFNGATYEAIKRWFDAIAEKSLEHGYKPCNMWNMDESGFGIGESQSTKVLIPITSRHKNKKIIGKQELVTDIECINAAGEAISPMIIFEGQQLNSGWIPPETPRDWFFSCSESGWTSNEIGLQWLIKIFEPQSRSRAAFGPGPNDIHQRLLIVDGHGSHIRADFIAHCMENKIDLLVMPAHCTHVLQPLDVGVFAAFKTAHSRETDMVSRLSSERIPRREWLEMFIRARAKAVTPTNIKAGWKGTGLVPSDPVKVLQRLSIQPPAPERRIHTPPEQITLDTTLLQSSPPEGTELHQSNTIFTQALRGSSGVISPIQRYAERMTRLVETQNATIAIQAKQLADQQQLLNKRNKHTRGKRVRLEGVVVYSSEDILKVAREEEAPKQKPGPKRSRGRPRKRPIQELETESEIELLINSSSDSEVGLEDCIGRRTRLRTKD